MFHPLFIPLFTVLCFFYIDENYLVLMEKVLVILQVTIITVLIPIAFFFLLRTLGKIDTIMASEVSQRRWPLAMQIVLLFLLLQQSITVDHVPELYFFFVGAILTSTIALICTFLKFKLSLHLAAIGAAVFFIVGLGIHNQYDLTGLVALLFVITGIVASSRLSMEAHSPAELAAGFLAGIAPQMALWYFWL